MPDFQDDLEEDVRELMAAKDEASAGSWSTASSDRSGSSTAAMLATLKLAPQQVETKFNEATHFVAVVQSRMRQDPNSLEARLWEIQTHSNRLWSLRQQALVGTCEASRGTKEYAKVAAEDNGASAASGITGWRPCCLRMAKESKLRHEQARGASAVSVRGDRYRAGMDQPAVHRLGLAGINISSALSNGLFMNSLRGGLCFNTDGSAWQRTWTPDNESDRCAICDELFTFLNRRHHCRRCSNLVCAVCSPHAVPLRVFSQTPEKPQRICQVCFGEIEQQQQPSNGLAGTSSTSRDGSFSILDPKARFMAAAPPPKPAVDVLPTDGDGDGHDPDHDSDPVEDAHPPSSPLLGLAIPSLTSTKHQQQQQQHALAMVPATIQCGPLDFLHTTGFRKNWHAYFFVLLIRKGSLGMFLTQTDHIEKKKRPTAVFKLSGYTIRIKSQKRRPHQFRLSHVSGATSKKPLHFAATSIEEMNMWISQLIKAIENANELEATAAATAATTGATSSKGGLTAGRDAHEDEETEV